MINKKIKTSYDSNELFLLFSKENQIIFLDSSSDDSELGHYSIIVFNPFIRFISKDNKIKIFKNENWEASKGDPLENIKALMEEYKQNKESHLPFSGGGVGYFSYDLAHQIEKLPRTAEDDTDIPDVVLNFYNGAIIYDHQKKETYYSDYDIDGKGLDRFNYIQKKIDSDKLIDEEFDDFQLQSEITSNFSKKEYLESITKIKDYIRDGDIYQANMTQRFSADIKGNPLHLYEKLRMKNPAPFSAYMDLGDIKVLSSSPERFIEVRNKIIRARPIKGTMPRGRNKEEDLLNKEILMSSEKDHAELLMIVDLERNDLGRVSKIGTVKVPELFKLETYATVFHLVSTVEAELLDNMDIKTLFEGIFPGGSITGAPKIRSMQIIDELEPTQRNIYTGSIGYLDFSGDLDLNIVIRTMVIKNNIVRFQVGGGIVWDSNEEMEYQETLDKGKALFDTLKKG